MSETERCPEGTGAYTWREDDTPAAVAARYGVSEADLRAINPGTGFAPGETVCVPWARCSQGRLYIVHRGDTFASIARAYGIGVEALSRANPFVEPDAIAVGQVLCVPPAAKEEPAGEQPDAHGQTDLPPAAEAEPSSGTDDVVLPQDPGEASPASEGVGSPQTSESTSPLAGDAGSSQAPAEGSPAPGDAGNAPADGNDTSSDTSMAPEASCLDGSRQGTVREGQSYADLLIENDVSYLAFRITNPGLEPGKLRAGQSYCVPQADALPACPLSERQERVREGEDLAALAERVGTSVGALLRRNPLLAPRDFRAGRVVWVR